MSWARTSRLPTTRRASSPSRLDVGARGPELVDDARHVLGDDAADEEIAGRQGPGDEERPRLDPVGDDGVGRPAELLDAADAGRVLVGPVDLRAHLVEEGGQVGDLRLPGAVAEDGLALGQGRGHEQVLRAGDGLLLEGDLGAAGGGRPRPGCSRARGRSSRRASAGRRCGGRSAASRWRSRPAGRRRPCRSGPGAGRGRGSRRAWPGRARRRPRPSGSSGRGARRVGLELGRSRRGRR